MKSKKIWLAFAAVMVAMGVYASGGHGNNPPYPNFGLPRVEEMMFLVLQIGVIIFAAKLGGIVASFFKMPSILGELAAGIVIGPWALGGIGFGDGIFSGGLFHGASLRALSATDGVMYAATTPELYGFATLASIILLFLSGLETNLRLFLKYSFVGLMVGIGGVIGSFVLGNLCAVYLLPEFFDKFKFLSEMPLAQAMMEAAPMYMGIMSTATSVGITARILSERKKMDSEEGVSIMAGAVIDDVLGLIVLAIGNGVIAATMAAKSAGGAASAGVNWSAIGMVAVKAFGVWLGATLIGVVAAKKMSWLLKCFKSHQAIATLAFGLAMILAGFFEYMGLAMIIGAYVMGLALSRTDLKHMIQETLSPVYTFLVPIFFCVMGMMVDCTALMSKPVLYFGAIYTALAVFAKIAGCAIPSLFCGFNLLGSLRIGAGMIPRGEVALIIAGLGLSNGYLSQEIFGIGIMMTLITTVVAPPMLVGLFNVNRAGLRGKRKANTEGSRPFSFQLASEPVAQLMCDKLVKAFQKEGFFTHLLSAEDNIWAIQMDDFEISMRLAKDSIHFECTPEEESLVMTAWMEVVGEIRDIAQSISKPIRQDDLETLLKNEAELKNAAGGGVSRYVQRFVMLPGFKATSKNEAIEKMIKAVTDAYPQRVADVEELKKAVFAREASMPTGLDCGIAVPHGRTDAVSGIIGAVAVVDNSENENGTIADYETIDHSAIQIIVLTVAPETAQSPYLQLMAFVSRALRANNGYEKLIQCKTEDEMRRFFRDAK